MILRFLNAKTIVGIGGGMNYKSAPCWGPFFKEVPPLEQKYLAPPPKKVLCWRFQWWWSGANLQHEGQNFMMEFHCGYCRILWRKLPWNLNLWLWKKGRNKAPNIGPSFLRGILIGEILHSNIQQQIVFRNALAWFVRVEQMEAGIGSLILFLKKSFHRFPQVTEWPLGRRCQCIPKQSDASGDDANKAGP